MTIADAWLGVAMPTGPAVPLTRTSVSMHPATVSFLPSQRGAAVGFQTRFQNLYKPIQFLCTAPSCQHSQIWHSAMLDTCTQRSCSRLCRHAQCPCVMLSYPYPLATFGYAYPKVVFLSS
jgi:hypothetical protein